MRTSSVLVTGPATACATAWPFFGMHARSPIKARGTCAAALAAHASERANANNPVRNAIRMFVLLGAKRIAPTPYDPVAAVEAPRVLSREGCTKGVGPTLPSQRRIPACASAGAPDSQSETA